MAEFKPDQRQQRAIAQALRSHRKAQARGQCAPERLVEKWSSEVEIQFNKKGSNASAEADSQGSGAQNTKEK